MWRACFVWQDEQEEDGGKTLERVRDVLSGDGRKRLMQETKTDFNSREASGGATRLKLWVSGMELRGGRRRVDEN